MKIFLSWSGERSKYIAETLSNWLEQVLQVAEPWISTDIEKGKRWSEEISIKLKESKVAIICLTNDNLDSKWIHFEAGAIAKTEDAYVCTFLFDINPTSVQQPLSQFQNTKNSKTDVLKLIKTINTNIGSSGGKSLKDKNLESVFNTFWPQLENSLKNIPKSKEGKIIRSDRELLEESLQILRNLKNNSSEGLLSPIVNDQYLDYYISEYAKMKGFNKTSVELKGHESQCADFIIKYYGRPFWTKNKEHLASAIKDSIDLLLPF